MAEVPQGGVPREWIARGDPQWATWADRYADINGVPRQLLYNILWMETGGNPNVGLNPNTVSSAGAVGLGQFLTGPRSASAAYGINPRDPEQGIRGAAQYLADIAYGRGQGAVQGVPERTVPNWAIAAGGYNAGPTGFANLELGRRPGLRAETVNYVTNVSNGVYNLDALPNRYQQLYGQQFEDFHTRGVPQNLDIAYPWATQEEREAFASGMPTHGNFWVPGDTGQEIGPNTGLDFTAPLPYAGTGLQGQSLQDWIASPTGGQQVAGLSAQSGYTLTPDVVEFVGRTAPELGRGPEGFSAGNFPWFTPGRISEDVGEVLQHHALMPNNLVFNPESLAWDVPQERRYPSNVGIWGAARVADWLPSSSPGFEQDYLKHLGYGAPPAGVLGNWMGQTPGVSTLGMGNQGFGNIADMSTYNHTPFDYTQWFGALGNQGATFDERFRGDPPAATLPDEPAATFDERFGTWPDAAQPQAGGSTDSALGESYHSALFPGMYYNTVTTNQMTAAQNALQQQMALQAAQVQQNLFNYQQGPQPRPGPSPWGQTLGTVSTGLEMY